MNDISEAERLALITQEQVRLVLQEAELADEYLAMCFRVGMRKRRQQA